jgi:soluble lytic murein transglycosylase-like protein
MGYFFVGVYQQEQYRQRIQSGEGGGDYYQVSAEIVTVTPTPQIEENTLEVLSYEKEATVNEFRYYKIPKEYMEAGGSLSEKVQEYTYSICEEYGVSYPIILAMIERESKYRDFITGDDGASKGYMQVMERWHKERMQELGVTDLYDPYDNILIGVDFLHEILDEYPDQNKALMVYNMGETGAKRLWKKGIYKTSYSKGVIERAQEIEQDIKD